MDKKFYKINKAIHTRNYVFNTHYHLVWVTKYRNKAFFTPSVVNNMEKILRYVAKKDKITIEKMEVMPDHVHLMLLFRPSLSISNVVKQLKGNSARLFLYKYPQLKKSQFWDGHLWSHSYYVGTVGDMSKKTVERYIANQYIDHRKKKSHFRG